MSALFVAPLSFTNAAPFLPVAGSVDNLNNDRGALTVRVASGTTIIVDLGSEQEFDTVAIIGSNLRAQDTFRIQVMNYDSTHLPAFTGSKPDGMRAKSIFRYPSMRRHRLVYVTLTANNHPDGYIEFQRLVIGKAIETIGIKFDAKLGVEDLSLIGSGAGYETIDRFARLPVWEFETVGISDDDWRKRWFPMLLQVGSSAGLLFIRDGDEPETWQTDAIFGRITNKAMGQATGYNWWTVAATIRAFAP